ncbi:protein PLASTID TRANSCRIPTIONALLY ACTIVE 16, chloroplastic [Vitis riparia]|uniref:protein PLASTID TRANSCRIPTIONALLY ACTIVE 16, chloroplastic n=1 Tax=Vitis riparia TaxID=96939 RepID=UPI00155AA150|nr:protein PLASTID TRANSCRIPTIONALLY ACTIVE 16, chloroplastic [Vitis riparia]XP_034688098.1 protein PLASTID TRANSCRIPTIONALLY ACTIVE 16, chloroplastic [Vitis riparia]
MAPTLTSNSFLLTTPPHPRLTLKNPSLRVYAKRAGPLSAFRLGKQSDGPSEESQENGSANSAPFSFNFGKVSDVSSLIPVMTKPSSGLSFGRRKDPGTVFVAGATGQAGIRIAQALLREGFSVRAGVSDLGAAQELARLGAKYKIISNEESKRLNAVESSFQDAESIAKAIGNASKVVVTIGSGENGPTAEVTPLDALQVIQAADLAGVGHVAIIYDESPFVSSTYNVIDGISTFFNNLFSRSQPLTVTEFLQKVVETDVSYTLIRTNLTEDFSPESSYNVVVSAEGSVSSNDYKVATSQIASLVANVFSNTAVAENKVVKVFTDPGAPSKPVVELFSAIPKDGRREAYAEALAKAKAEEEALKATEKARDAAEAAKKLQQEVKKLSEQETRAATLADEAKEKAEAAGASVEGFLIKAKDLGSGLSWEKFSSQLAISVQKPTEKPKVQIATVRGQAKARSLQPKKAVVKLPTFPRPPAFKPKEEPKPKGKQPESKAEVRKVFGGLFKQETIYIDDD